MQDSTYNYLEEAYRHIYSRSDDYYGMDCKDELYGDLD